METKVEVLGARNLAPKDPNGLSDPYCVVGLADPLTGGFVDTPACIRSKTHYLTLSPVWRNVLFTTESEVHQIRIEVWDKSHDVSDNFEGYALVSICLDDAFADAWVPLCPRSQEDGSISGDVHVVVSRCVTNKIHPSVSINQQERMVRVFLSSTFMDMREERDVIMRKVMVDLDRFCYERGVALSYIDMRWGITDEMTNNNKTITTCLREVDNSRPYFVGFLAQRYGWHQDPDAAEDVLLRTTFEAAEARSEFAWVKNFRARSVTELEFLHGFLLHPSLSKGHCFLYFRDPCYLDTLSDKKGYDHAKLA